MVAAATVAEVTGSILWGVYRYRMHNLPLFVPPGHGLVYLSGVALSQTLRRHARALVGCAAAGAAIWGLTGLTVLPRLDVAGALGVPLLLLFLWRSESRAGILIGSLVNRILDLIALTLMAGSAAVFFPGSLDSGSARILQILYAVVQSVPGSVDPEQEVIKRNAHPLFPELVQAYGVTSRYTDHEFRWDNTGKCADYTSFRWSGP